MKNIIALFICLFAFTSLHSQTVEERTQKIFTSEMDLFKSTLVAQDGDIGLNKNQEVKIKQLFKNKSEEIVSIRSMEIGKGESTDVLKKLNERYDRLLNDVLTQQQIEQMEKNKKTRRARKS